MTKKFKILTQYIKDISGETNNVETYLFVKENISKYHLNIDIISKALKNKLIEINTTLKFEDKENNEKKSYFEIIYASVISVDKDIKRRDTYVETVKLRAEVDQLNKNISALWEHLNKLKDRSNGWTRI